MSNKNYVFNPQTLQYEKVKRSPIQKLKRYSGLFSAISITSIAVALLFYAFFPSPKEKSQDRHITQLQYSYASINDELQKIANELENLQEKDAEVHRIIFGLNPIDESVWEGGTGGSNRFQHLDNFGQSGDLMKESELKVEKLRYKLELQKKSLDTIYNMALERKEKLSSIPSIKPVREDQLKRKIRYMSGFGWRIHPIHKVKKFHKGIDFTAPKGTPIQATGDGKVKKISKKKRGGYGYSVTIDHGYGYETLYAHMEKIMVKKGDKVTKGQQIGTVGNTGLSTAPHCHYEVIKNGKSVNPIDYVMDGLSPLEYQELVKNSKVENQSFH